MKRLHHVLFFTIALSLAAPGCSYRLVRKGRINQPLLQKIKDKVSARRGLVFLEAVQIEVITRRFAAILFEDKFNEEYPPARVAVLERVYARMGLIDSGVDLKKLILDFYETNVAGFYDPDAKKLYLVKEVVERFSIWSFIFQRDANAEMVMAHELTHALDDQHFNLDSIEERIVDNDDALLAFQALEEGTATLVGMAAIYHSRIEMEKIVGAMTSYGNLIDKLLRVAGRDVPPILIDSVAFAYVAGTNFVAFLYKISNNWSEINAAYTTLPASSEEVLHPEKFIKKNDPPSKINLTVSPRSFGDDRVLLEQNTLGELGISSLLRRFIPLPDAKTASRGWGGDRYVVVGSPDEKTTLWIWITEWDTDDDAAEFFAAYRSLLPLKYEDIESVACPVDEGKCWKNSDGELIWMNRLARRISVIEGADHDTLPAAVRYTIPSVIAQPHQRRPGRIYAPATASISVP